MATILSSSSHLISNSSTITNTNTNSPKLPQIQALPKIQLPIPLSKSSLSSLAAATLAAATILSTTPPSIAVDSSAYNLYYGTAASAANYGGYGGNSNKKDSAEYVYDVPNGWKERLVSKVEKGTYFGYR